jgi:hypothetical protein
MAEELKPDLFDPANVDNYKFVNLLDDAKWQRLKQEYAEGTGRPLNELLKELLESR